MTRLLYWPFNTCTLGRLAIFLLVTLLAGALPAAAPADVSGFWVLSAPTGDGNVMKTFLDLKQSGGQVTGTAWIRTSKFAIREGSYSGGKLHLEVALSTRHPEHVVRYDGTADGGKLSLTIREWNLPPAAGIAGRGTPDAMAPPARLPLPALHEVADNGLARTPPMGWNSWNKFANRVDDTTVRAMANAMVASGMKDVGYTYINIDDTWEGPRGAQGNITGNRKFPNMKGLADYVHSRGLKIGIYSSPGPETCGGYPGSYGHEAQDAKTYAAWGFDYLKYDWCSANSIYQISEMPAVYQKMGDPLLSSGRPIIFSICQFGSPDVWVWGPRVGGNLWRTTADIEDTWKRMEGIGFSQFPLAPYARPGHWNDPDMLEIGNGGMTADEYRTHLSLWALLAAPLLAGNDLRAMTEETRSILMNREVIAIDQDPTARPVKKISEQGPLVVAARPLLHQKWAVGLFNRSDTVAKMIVAWDQLGWSGKQQVRDLWEHKDLGSFADQFTADVPPHGVVLITVSH